MEIWKDIKGYEGLYQISNIGRVKSLPRKMYNGVSFFYSKEKILKNCLMTSGYFYVGLCKNNKRKNKSIHRLVSIAWISNPKNKTDINHKNHIKTDNRISNLEWCTTQENIINCKKTNNKKSSLYKGVCKVKRELVNPWVSKLMYNGKTIFLGYHKNEKEAALAYNKKAKEIFGSFAFLNKIN